MSQPKLERVDESYEIRMAGFEVDCNDGKGEPSACHHVGEFYAAVKEEYGRAANIYSTNCHEKKYGPSCFTLGRLHLSGRGVDQDDKKALKLFETGCKDGLLPACYFQAMLLYSGLKPPGTITDPASFSRGQNCADAPAPVAPVPAPAAKKTNAELAQEKKDKAEALKIFDKACNLGENDSCYFLGSKYLSEKNPDRDPIKAIPCLKRACDSNHAPSCFNLAVLYNKGDKGVEKNPELFEQYKEKTNNMKKVWVPNKDTAWELVDILSIGNEAKEEEKTLTVTMPVPAEGGGAGRLRTSESILKKLTHVHDPSHSVDAALLDDLCSFNHLHEAPILDGLHRRYKKDLIYTNISNSVLVSINPYKHIPALFDSVQPYLDNTDNSNKANKSVTGPAEPPAAPKPHVFTIANQAFAEMSNKASVGTPKSHIRNQSIMVGGESGSGKTEAAKYALHYLLQADIAHQKAVDALNQQTLNTVFAGMSTSGTKSGSKRPAVPKYDAISSVITPSSVIFETFGNAKTLHNNNSSRFGKYMKLQYGADHGLVSAYTETFLLEKSRLITIGEHERNYHVFYALLNTATATATASTAAAPNSSYEALNTLRLTSAADFKILCDGTGKVSPSARESTLDALSAALSAVGCTTEEQGEVWSILAALLHLGNITCESVIDHDKPQVDENYSHVDLLSPSMPLSTLTFLLGVSSLTFEARVLTQRVQVGNRDSIHIKQLDAKDVANNIHALIKWIYSSLFDWVLKKVNSAHTSTARSSEKPVSFIGILDIFGFEILEKNSFEQLCINYTNECMQQMFYQHVFDREQQLYAEEGLQWTPITYRNNQEVIDLIAKKPTGLLNLLEELSLLNRGGRDEEALLASYNSTHASSSVYEKPRFGTKNLFLVRHFAGTVTYSVSGFMEKNNDALQEDLLALMLCSSNAFIQNAIVATGMSQPGTEGQSGFVAEVPGEKLVSGCEKTAGNTAAGAGASAAGDAGEEEASAAATAAYVSSAIAMRKARQAGRRTSMAVMANPEAAAVAESGGHTNKKLAAAVTVSYQFRSQLEELLLTLQGTQPRYVMCLKPNAHKASDALDRVLVLEQLRYSGALEVVRIRQLGFPISLSFMQFTTVYQGLLDRVKNTPGQAKTNTLSARDAAEKVCAEYLPVRGDYQVGKSRLFLRTAAYAVLQTAVQGLVVHKISVFQALVRKHLAQKSYQRTRHAVVALQSRVRMFVKRKIYKQDMAHIVRTKVQSKKAIEQRNQEIGALEERVLALHAACVAGEINKVRDLLIKKPEDYYTVNWLRNNCSVLQSAILGGNLGVIQYLKPRPEELEYQDSDGNVAVHYAAKSLAIDKTEVLRYLSFIIEPAYVKEINNVPVTKGGQKYTHIRPLHSKIQTPALPRHMDPAFKESGQKGSMDDVLDEENDYSATLTPTRSTNALVKKAIEADSRQAVPGAAPGSVLKTGWLSKRGFKTASMWRKRWVVLTTEALNYYHTDKDTVPRDSLSLRSKDCITVTVSAARACALDITMAEGVGTAGKQREMISLLAESEKDMHDWINILTAVAGTDATPLRMTQVRTISPVLSDNLFSARNSLFETPLHALCGLTNAESGGNKSETEKVLPATAAWLIHRNCPVNTANLKGKSPLFLAIETGRYHLGLLLLRYGATVPPHCGAKHLFLSFIGDENNPDKVIPALQFLPKPIRLRNFHYLSIEILQHFIGNLSNFLDMEDASAYFITVSSFTANHVSLGATQYSQCPLIRLLPKAPVTTTTGSTTVSRTGTDSQLVVWYNQFHLQVPLENVEEGAYLQVELSKAITNNANVHVSSPSVSAGQGSHRQSTSRSSGANTGGGGGAIASLAWFLLKIDKEVLNTSVLTIPFLKHPIVRNAVPHTTTTADAHAGNMHSVASVETTIYRRNAELAALLKFQRNKLKYTADRPKDERFV